MPVIERVLKEFVGGLRIPIRYRFTSAGHWEQVVITPES